MFVVVTKGQGTSKKTEHLKVKNRDLVWTNRTLQKGERRGERRWMAKLSTAVGALS